MQTVAITGATGFIGRRLVARLLAQGARVRALVLPGEVAPLDWAGRVDSTRGDVRDFDAVRRVVAGASVVYHLAAVVGDWGDPRSFAAVAYEGTRHAAIASVRAGARLVLVSSIVYYGADLSSAVCEEGRLPGKPLGPYSRAKQAQERLAWAFSRGAGLDLVVIRPANVYGPQSGPWVNDLTDHLRRGLPSLIGGGHGDAALLHVENLVDLLLAARAAEARGRAYNACDPPGITWRRYLTDLAALAGAPAPRSIPKPLAALAACLGEPLWRLLRRASRPPLTAESLNLVGANLRIPTDRAHHELGWRPALSYEQGLASVADWLQTQAR